jgi:hypothetical protein
MNSLRVRNQSHDALVKLTAYAALTGASVVALRAILVEIFHAKLTDPSNQALAPTFQWIAALTSVAIWGLLFVVAVGLFRLARPWSISSKAGLVIAGFGAALLALDQLAVAATNKYFISPHVADVGRLAVAIWLLLANTDLRQREILPRGLTLLGLLFGIELALVTIEQWIHVTTLFGGRAGLVAVSVGGLLVWQIWLGMTLLRRPHGGIYFTSPNMISLIGELDIVSKLEHRFLPILDAGAQGLRAEFGRHDIRTWSHPVGSDSSLHGYAIAIDCMPRDLDDAYHPDTLRLEISARHVDTKPLLDSAMVSWNPPSGYIEIDLVSIPEPASAQRLDELEAEIPQLLDTVREALRRGSPPR